MFFFCKMSKALDEDPDPAVFLNADQEPASQNRVTLNFVQKYLMKSLYGLTTHQHNCHAFLLFLFSFFLLDPEPELWSIPRGIRGST